MSDDTVRAVDLFCGAGGISTGLALACEDLDRDVELVAVNHWTTAIETHQQNHEWAEHRNAKVEALHPPAVVPPGDVDILVAAPECTHFSNARGSKPVDEQKRASPWHVVDWAQKLRPTNLLLENVQELENWGPVDENGKPTHNGGIFDAWVDSLHALGYSVDWRVLNAADYGDATSRKRLFVVGRLDKRAEFPLPTHSKHGDDETEPWRPASEIIDWSDPGTSVWSRDLTEPRVHNPLKSTTMRRIAQGLREHGDDQVAAFADVVEDIDRETVYEMRENAVDVADLETAVVERGEPFLVKYYGTASTRPLGVPLDTITAGGQKFALATPYLLGQQSGATPRNVDEPVPTIATKGAISKIEPRPFVLSYNGRQGDEFSNPHYDPADRPLHVIRAKNQDNGYFIRPYLVPFYGEHATQKPRTHDIDEPCPTIPASKSPAGVCRPFLVQYYGNSDTSSVADPVPTVTTRDRFALVAPDLYPWGLDIHFRMLQPRELAAAMGFPTDYEFAGNKGETVEQIGNAVPVHLAKALCRHLLVGDAPSLTSFTESDPAEAVRGEADD